MVGEPVFIQESLSRALADIRDSLRQQKLDPLRYLVDIDAGLAPFAPRDVHRLRIGYNHHDELAVEFDIAHACLVEPAGAGRDRFLAMLAEQVGALKARVQSSGRPL